jgi:hypothetical protein
MNAMAERDPLVSELASPTYPSSNPHSEAQIQFQPPTNVPASKGPIPALHGLWRGDVPWCTRFNPPAMVAKQWGCACEKCRLPVWE